MKRRSRTLLIATSTVALISHPALAASPNVQTAPSPGTVLTPPEPSPDLPKREVPKLQEQLNLPDGSSRVLNFQFSSVRVAGAKVIDAKKIAAKFDGLLNKRITAADLRTALDSVNKLYTDQGYALGRAYIPIQVVRGGTLIVRVVEGYIGRITVDTDNDRLRHTIERFSNRITAERPLTVDTLQRYLLLISEIPGLKIGGQLTAMNVYTGSATLALTTDYDLVSATTALDNRSNLEDLPFASYVTGMVNDAFGQGDQLSVTALASPELDKQQYYRAAASTFIGSDGLRATVGASYAKSLSPDLPAPNKLISESRQFDFALSYPLIRAVRQTLKLEVGGYYTKSNNILNGIEFSEDAIRAVYAGAQYTGRIGDTITVGGAFRMTQGLSIFGAGPDNTLHSRLGAVPNFTKLYGNATLVYAATERLLITLKATGQYSPDSLFSSEEISFGGAQFGRGYDTSEISGDSGYGFSAQAGYRFDVEVLGGWSLTPYTFIDHSRVFNQHVDLQGNAQLLSTGVGINASNRKWLSLGLEMDKPINREVISKGNKDPRLFVSAEVRF